MSGYTPVFDSMLDGTLYGRWPHTGIWACLLSKVSRDGTIDKAPEMLAAAIGCEVQVLLKCIHDFMQPDPHSRTQDHEGRRLALIDPARPWGWRVLNAGIYREKARKKAFDTVRTESGEDAARKQAQRSAQQTGVNVPTRPAKSRRVPLSESDTNTNKKNPPIPPVGGASPVEGVDVAAWTRWEIYRREKRKPIKPGQEMQAAQQKLAGFGSAQAAVVQQSIENGWTGLFALKSEGQRYVASSKTGKFDSIHSKL